jgi:hypothetical protein
VESCSARFARLIPLPAPSEDTRLAVAEFEEVADVVAMLSRTAAFQPG